MIESFKTCRQNEEVFLSRDTGKQMRRSVVKQLSPPGRVYLKPLKVKRENIIFNNTGTSFFSMDRGTTGNTETMLPDIEMKLCQRKPIISKKITPAGNLKLQNNQF